MASNTPPLSGLRPGMEHLNFTITISKMSGIRKVKTYTGVEHTILEGEVTDGQTSVSFAVWNEKADLFSGIKVGDKVELVNCFVTSFKGVLQINVGRDSDARKVEA